MKLGNCWDEKEEWRRSKGGAVNMAWHLSEYEPGKSNSQEGIHRLVLVQEGMTRPKISRTVKPQLC